MHCIDQYMYVQYTLLSFILVLSTLIVYAESIGSISELIPETAATGSGTASYF